MRVRVCVCVMLACVCACVCACASACRACAYVSAFHACACVRVVYECVCAWVRVRVCMVRACLCGYESSFANINVIICFKNPSHTILAKHIHCRLPIYEYDCTMWNYIEKIATIHDGDITETS